MITQNEIEWVDGNCEHDFEEEITEVFFFAGSYYHKMRRCKKCGKFASADMIGTHPTGHHEFVIPRKDGFLKCKYCNLEVYPRPVIYINGE